MICVHTGVDDSDLETVTGQGWLALRFAFTHADIYSTNVVAG
jgi:hypothetical protein